MSRAHACHVALRAEVERRLVALGIAHADNLDVRCVLHVVHRLGSNKDELSANRTSRSLDNHFHAALAVDAVHEYIARLVSVSLATEQLHLQLVKTADGRTHGVPKRKQETNGRIRLLTAR
jgi:hypothetical protein